MANTAPKGPLHNLAALQAAAARKDGFHIVRKARQDAENLGYDPEGVRQIICNLTPADYFQVWILKNSKGLVTDKDGKPVMMDVYHPEITAPNGDTCKIYLKLQFSDGKITATTANSFHQFWK